MAFHDEQSYPCSRDGVPELYQGIRVLAAKAHDKPGLLAFESIDSSSTKEVLYFWLNGSGQLRFSTSIPTDQDADGDLLPKVKKIGIAADFGNTEQDTGWDLPSKCIVLGVWVDVTTADTGETLDVGTLSTDSGDADGFLDGISVGTTGVKKGTLASAGQTLGALLRVDESGSGVLVPEPCIAPGSVSVTYTGSATTNTMRGSIYIEYIDLT